MQPISRTSLYVDQALLKKIRRIQQSKRATQNANDDSDDSDDRPADGRNANMSIMLDDASGADGFDTLIDDADHTAEPKMEPQSDRLFASSRATQVVEIGDEEDESDEDEEGESDEEEEDETMED